MTDAAEHRNWWFRLPAWGRIGLIAGAVVILALAGIVGFRLLSRVPSIPLGTTAVGDLRVGSCLAEGAADLEQYTVVSCDAAHAQQMFATADVALPASTYADAAPALEAFGDQVCSHYLEYRLFLVDHLVTLSYVAFAIDVPTPDRYAAGDTLARCVIAPADGSDLTEDLYRPMP